jgi:hypothetical protein
LTAAALLALAAVLVVMSLRLDYLSDDAFILFRYARNLVRGDGLVFNPGVRVEGYTSFLMVLVLAALHAVGADLVAAGRAISMTAGAATVILTFLIARRLLPGRIWLPLSAPLLLCVNPYLAAWAGAGLETTLFTTLLLACLLLLLPSPFTPERFLLASLTALLLCLTRPEGVLLYAVIIAWGIAAAGGSSGRLRTVGPGVLFFTIVGGIYFVFRYAYFGDLLPNTFYAKSGFTHRHALRGMEYVGAFLKNPFAIALSPLVATGVFQALRRRGRLLVVQAIAIVAVVVLEGGDGLPMYRFLVPLLPLAAVLAALGMDGAIQWLGLRRGGIAAAVIMMAGAVLSFFPNRDTQYNMYYNQRHDEIPRWSAVGRSLAHSFPAGTTIAAVPIGAVAYYSDLPAIDLVGLTDRSIAHTPLPTLGGGRAGHEKYNSAYVLSRSPDVLLLGNIYVSKYPYLRPGFRLYSSTAAEQDIVRQRAFRNLYRRAVLGLGEGRGYLHYYLRRDRGLEGA